MAANDPLTVLQDPSFFTLDPKRRRLRLAAADSVFARLPESEQLKFVKDVRPEDFPPKATQPPEIGASQEDLNRLAPFTSGQATVGNFRRLVGPPPPRPAPQSVPPSRPDDAETNFSLAAALPLEPLEPPVPEEPEAIAKAIAEATQAVKQNAQGVSDFRKSAIPELWRKVRRINPPVPGTETPGSRAAYEAAVKDYQSSVTRLRGIDDQLLESYRASVERLRPLRVAAARLHAENLKKLRETGPGFRSDIGRIHSDLDLAVQSAINYGVGSVLKNLGIAGRELEKAWINVTRPAEIRTANDVHPLESYWTYWLGDRISYWAALTYPVNPAFANEFHAKAVDALVWTGMFYALGSATEALGLSKAAQLAAVSTWTGGTYATEPYEEKLSEAEERGKEADERRLTYQWLINNGWYGGSTIIPIEKALEGFDKLTGGFWSRWLGKAIKRGVAGSFEGAMQKFFEDTGHSLINALYEPASQAFADIPNSIATGGLTGLALGMIGHGTSMYRASKKQREAIRKSFKRLQESYLLADSEYKEQFGKEPKIDLELEDEDEQEEPEEKKKKKEEKE
jgi:hypothetical protein